MNKHAGAADDDYTQAGQAVEGSGFDLNKLSIAGKNPAALSSAPTIRGIQSRLPRPLGCAGIPLQHAEAALAVQV